MLLTKFNNKLIDLDLYSNPYVSARVIAGEWAVCLPEEIKVDETPPFLYEVYHNVEEAEARCKHIKDMKEQFRRM